MDATPSIIISMTGVMQIMCVTRDNLLRQSTKSNKLSYTGKTGCSRQK